MLVMQMIIIAMIKILVFFPHSQNRLPEKLLIVIESIFDRIRLMMVSSNVASLIEVNKIDER